MTIKIKLGKQFMPRAIIPAYVSYWTVSDKEFAYHPGNQDGRQVPANSVVLFYRVINEPELVLPKEPKIGEVWSAKSDARGIIYGEIESWDAQMCLKLGYAHIPFAELEFIRRWQPVEEETK